MKWRRSGINDRSPCVKSRIPQRNITLRISSETYVTRIPHQRIRNAPAFLLHSAKGEASSELRSR